MKMSHSVALFVHCISAILAVFAPVAFFAMQARPVSADSPSYVRIIHASPDIATTDVFLDGKVLLSTFTFATVTNYAIIPAGPHKVQAALIGRGPIPPAVSQAISINPGLAYTIAAIGTKSTG